MLCTATNAAHDREQDEREKRVESAFPVIWIKPLQKRPRPDLADVVEQFVEK